MTSEEFIRRINSLTVWKRGDQRAPHKPLLLLLMLGRVSQGRTGQLGYREVKPELVALLKRFGPHREVHHPEAPFGSLVNDGIWEVRDGDQIRRSVNKTFLDSDLYARNALGGFLEHVYDLLKDDPALIYQAVDTILHNEFPESYHAEIMEAVGLSGDRVTTTRLKRDPAFRLSVLEAYQFRCAVCCYDVRLEQPDEPMERRMLGLEAAHILWHARKGPDKVSNGLALCSTHHYALDRGGIGIDDDMKLMVSSQLEGEARGLWFDKYRGVRLQSPQQEHDRPCREYLQWHRDQVFRG